MKRTLLAAGVIGLCALASCNSGTSTGSAENAAASIDSMVDQATSAVREATDSLSRDIQRTADSTSAAIDSIKNSQ